MQGVGIGLVCSVFISNRVRLAFSKKCCGGFIIIVGLSDNNFEMADDGELLCGAF